MAPLKTSTLKTSFACEKTHVTCGELKLTLQGDLLADKSQHPARYTFFSPVGKIIPVLGYCAVGR